MDTTSILGLLQQIGLPLIAVAVPIVMMGVKPLIAWLPKAAIPVIAGLLPPLVDQVGAWLAGYQGSPELMAICGLAGVGIREVFAQAWKDIQARRGGGTTLSTSGFATVALVALMGLAAGGCSRMLPQMAPIMGAAPAGEGDGEGVGAAQTWLDEMADGIVAAKTAEDRALRVCFFSAVAAEVWVYRILYYGAGNSDEAMTAAGAIARMRSSVESVRAAATSLWFETEMFYAAAGIVRAVEGPLRDRALAAVGNLVLHDWRGIAHGLRQSAGQALLASAMFRDARAAAAAIAANTVDRATAWRACEGRIDQKLAAINAAIGIAPPPPLRL